MVSDIRVGELGKNEGNLGGAGGERFETFGFFLKGERGGGLEIFCFLENGMGRWVVWGVVRK